jgi:hypothetical protein
MTLHAGPGGHLSPPPNNFDANDVCIFNDAVRMKPACHSLVKYRDLPPVEWGAWRKHLRSYTRGQGGFSRPLAAGMRPSSLQGRTCSVS